MKRISSLLLLIAVSVMAENKPNKPPKLEELTDQFTVISAGSVPGGVGVVTLGKFSNVYSYDDPAMEIVSQGKSYLVAEHCVIHRCKPFEPGTVLRGELQPAVRGSFTRSAQAYGIWLQSPTDSKIRFYFIRMHGFAPSTAAQ